LVPVGSVARPLLEKLTAAAAALKLGPGLDPATRMGPVITSEARERIVDTIDKGVSAGARLARDGRGDRVREHPRGYFVGPTILDEIHPDMPIAKIEVFGPVLTTLRVRDLDEAIDTINASPFGNSASIYTTSGAAAREFRKRVEAGMLGVNLGVPAPMPFFPFCGWKGSFFGELHTQGRDGIEFYTRRKVVTSRWT
jgi:malonate-semialdehyde dehydrogenase (acetylating)/methylmalonate-semialdehyde dehydrogenase